MRVIPRGTSEPRAGPTMEGTSGAADGVILRGNTQEAALGPGARRKPGLSAASLARAGSQGPELRLRTPVVS